MILNSVSLGLRTEPEASDDEIDISVKRTLDNIKNGDNSDVLNCEVSDGSESSPSREHVRLSDVSPARAALGELPIAQYEGSPRRYGLGSHKPTRSPRPGFPQVSCLMISFYKRHTKKATLVSFYPNLSRASSS